jgi:hypothetical protein
VVAQLARELEASGMQSGRLSFASARLPSPGLLGREKRDRGAARKRDERKDRAPWQLLFPVYPDIWVAPRSYTSDP